MFHYVNNIYVQKKPSKRADKNQTNLATEELSLAWGFRPSKQYLFSKGKVVREMLCLFWHKVG